MRTSYVFALIMCVGCASSTEPDTTNVAYEDGSGSSTQTTDTQITETDQTGSGTTTTTTSDPVITTLAAKSKVSGSYDDGNPDSMFPMPPTMESRCDIPAEVLKEYPLLEGDPKMTKCRVTTLLTGDPPSTLTTMLECNTCGDYGPPCDSISCTSVTHLLAVPPTSETSGSVSYVGHETPVSLGAERCDAYIARANGICEKTGETVE